MKKNPSSGLYTQLGVITKGTVIEVNVSELGLVTTSGKVSPVRARSLGAPLNPQVPAAASDLLIQGLTPPFTSKPRPPPVSLSPAGCVGQVRAGDKRALRGRLHQRGAAGIRACCVWNTSDSVRFYRPANWLPAYLRHRCGSSIDSPFCWATTIHCAACCLALAPPYVDRTTMTSCAGPPYKVGGGARSIVIRVFCQTGSTLARDETGGRAHDPR